MLLLITACASAPTPVDRPGNLTSQEQAVSEDEPGPVFPACPEDPATFRLQPAHTYTFRPGGDSSQLRLEGSTDPADWCLVTVTGRRVEADECHIGYRFAGVVQTSDGPCEVQGTSTARLTIEGECLPGAPGDEGGIAEVYLEITEIQDPDSGLAGAVNCPGFSFPTIGYYPPTYSVMSFVIEQGGASDSDHGTDPSGFFEYRKTWTLIPAGYPFE